MKKRLKKRLVYLYSGELTAIILFAPASYQINQAYPDLQLYSLYSFWTSFILLEFLLLQGTYYWHAKLKRLKSENTLITPLNVVRQLRALKKLNIVLIFGVTVAFVFDFIKWYPVLPLGGGSIALFIYIFALLEFINYFYIQLSYDNASDIKYLLKSKKLKRSAMNKDFERLKALRSEGII